MCFHIQSLQHSSGHPLAGAPHCVGDLGCLCVSSRPVSPQIDWRSTWEGMTWTPQPFDRTRVLVNECGSCFPTHKHRSDLNTLDWQQLAVGKEHLDPHIGLHFNHLSLRTNYLARLLNKTEDLQVNQEEANHAAWEGWIENKNTGSGGLKLGGFQSSLSSRNEGARACDRFIDGG